MAVDFGKLNKAGLGASSFGTRKTRGASSQAAQNLANTTTATKSSLFSFKGTRMNNWVPGQHINKNMHKYNYQGMRASMNSRTFTPSYAGPAGSIGHMHGAANNIGTVTYNNDYAKGMIIGQTVAQGINLLNQLGVFGGNNGGGVSSVGSKLSSALSGLGGGSSSLAGVTSAEVSAAISNMNSASDSVALRSAITSAETELNSLNTKISEAGTSAETKETEEKSDVDEANKDYNTKKQDYTKSEQKVSSQQNVLDAKTHEVSNARKDVEQASAKVDSATIEVENAESNLINKENDLASAEIDLTNTPETKTIIGPDGEPKEVENQPALRLAKQKVEKAEQAKKKAQADVDKAQEKLRDAEQAKDKAQEKLRDAEQAKEKAQESLNAAKNEQAELKEKLDDSKETLNKEKAEYEEAKTESDKVKEMKADAEALKTAIREQKERLSDLEKAEEKEYSSLDTQIDKDVNKNSKDISKINYDDGLSKKEQRKSDKIGERNERISNNEAKRDGLENNVDLTYVMKQLPTYTDASGSYRTGTNPLTGNTVYARDNQLITEEEFKAATGANV